MYIIYINSINFISTTNNLYSHHKHNLQIHEPGPSTCQNEPRKYKGTSQYKLLDRQHHFWHVDGLVLACRRGFTILLLTMLRPAAATATQRCKGKNVYFPMPLVPHKAAAEVSKIKNYRKAWMAEPIHWWTERSVELYFLEWLQWSPHPQLLDVLWCSIM